jgi:hypothetical protein
MGWRHNSEGEDSANETHEDVIIHNTLLDIRCVATAVAGIATTSRGGVSLNSGSQVRNMN